MPARSEKRLSSPSLGRVAARAGRPGVEGGFGQPLMLGRAEGKLRKEDIEMAIRDDVQAVIDGILKGQVL